MMSVMHPAPKPRSIGQQLAGPLAQMWADGRGPSRSRIESALSVAGVDPSEYSRGSKEQLVGNAMREAEDADAVNLAKELVDVLQMGGVFESAEEVDVKYVKRLREAFGRIDVQLTDSGLLDWNPKSAPARPDAGPDDERLSDADRERVQALDAVRRARAALTPQSRAVVQVDDSVPVGPSLDFLLKTLRRLPGAARPLTGRRSRGSPSIEVHDEYHAQDFVHMALRLLYPDVRPEEVVPSYAGKSSRMDFLVRDERAAVEVKVTAPNRGARDIRGEIILDQREYKGHPHVRQLVVVVFDFFDKFDNPVGFERDLSGTYDGLLCVVLVVSWQVSDS